MKNMHIQHHGAVNGVTGSCHQLHINKDNSVLIDCGLFQGAETSGKTTASQLTIDFDISTVKALIVTHCHIDHVGRIPYLLAAGFSGPIYATQATAALLPMVIEDALKVGVTRNKVMIQACIQRLQRQLFAIEYKQWLPLSLSPLVFAEEQALSLSGEYAKAKIKFQPAGHILGSAYIEIDLIAPINQKEKHRVVFSGDLGAPYAPLLPAPRAPYRADTLIIESTYGDKVHDSRHQRSQLLWSVLENCVADNGVVLIPAFSIGRTQELLYEIEQFIYQSKKKPDKNSETKKSTKAKDNLNSVNWQDMEIIVDSPMAANFTQKYAEFKTLWDKEAQRKLKQGRHPLDFEQLYTIDSHQAHLSVVNYLSHRNKPAIVIAASGMCSGGRIMRYLQTFLSDVKADVVFVGYQARGTLGRDIQRYGPRGGYVMIDGQRIDINAGIHTISGYSAHADQLGLINFVKRMRHKPQQIRIVHGDDEAKAALKLDYSLMLPNVEVIVPDC